MKLHTIWRKITLEHDVWLARAHGRIVGGSDDGFDDSCMPWWIWNHRSPRVRQAWWSGFSSEGDQYCKRKGL